MKKLFCILIISFLFLTCNRDSLEDFSSGFSPRSEKGKIFVQNLKTSPGWENGWQTVTGKGTPLVDHVIVDSRDEHGIYYLLPILSGEKIINCFALYEMKISVVKSEAEIYLEQPVILTKEMVEKQPVLKNAISSITCNILSGEGYVIADHFIPDEYRELKSRYGGSRTRVYSIMYYHDGERLTPWTEDRRFLSQFMNLYDRLKKKWNYSCRMLITSTSIRVTVSGIQYGMNFNALDNDVLDFMGSIRFTLPEVIVVPDESSFDASIVEDYTIPETNFPAGLYMMEDGKIESVHAYLSSVGPPQPPAQLRHVDPCDYMSDRIEDSRFNQEMEKLKRATGLSFEVAAYFTLNAVGGMNMTYKEGPEDGGEVLFYVDNPIDGIIHTHNSDGLPVFSVDDLIVPYKLRKDGKMVNPKRFTMGLVTPHTTLFLFFDTNVYYNWMKKNEGNLSEYSDMYKKIYRITKDTPSDLAVENFASLLKSWNIGITLMEKDPQSNRYKRVERKDGRVVKTICD